jgi:AP endonuclease-1
MAHTDPDRTKQAYESYVDDLRRCDKLGIRLYNIHPGNTVSNDRQTAIAHLAKNINRAHKEVPNVITLLENMAAGGNVLGSTFEDLRDTIALVEDKSRIGVCMDTCHAFAAGYDLRSPEAFKQTMTQFEEIVGFKYLRAMHLNDSKAPFASHRDLHANIGTGFLGLRAFHNVVNESRFVGLPLVLETPIDDRQADGTPVLDGKGKQKESKEIWAQEIKLLESMVGMDVESDEFLTMEKALARKGESERKKLAEQQERKKEKEAKKAAKGMKGEKKLKKQDETEDDASDLSSEG